MIGFLASIWEFLLIFLQWYAVFFTSGAVLSLLLMFFDVRLWRAPFFVLIWGAFLLIKVPTIGLGLFVVAYLYTKRKTHYEKLPAWTRPWWNLEDWMGQPNHFADSLPKWWAEKKGTGFWSWYKYHAIRNGANGLRSFKLLNLKIDPKKVRYFTPDYHRRYTPQTCRKFNVDTVWYVCWQGWKAGFKLVHVWNDERHFVVKIGWRVRPSNEEEETSFLTDHAGFATKLLPYREG